MRFPNDQSNAPGAAVDTDATGATGALARNERPAADDVDGANDATGALAVQDLGGRPGSGSAITGESVAVPGGAAASAADAEPWRVGSRYRVVARLGSGGMADVFRAHDELLARDVAVKVFRAQPQAPETDTSANRQLAELHALARLNHPNLITLYDGSISETDGPAYLVMELIDGSTLADRVTQGPMPHDEVREIGAQIATALAYVHAQGMVHRDVKPANILLGVDRTDEDATVRARLSDFGIVRLLGTERMTSVNFTLGTASYLAPEQARGADVGPPADVYSLGLVLIETLSGTRSFDGSPLEAALARLERDPEMPTDLPPAWTSLLQAMTAREPAVRPTASQVATLLRADAATAAVPIGSADAETHALRLPGAAVVGIVGGASLAATPASALAARPYPDDELPAHPGHTGGGRLFAWLAAAVALAAIVVGGAMVLRPSTPADSSTPSTGPSSLARTGSTSARASRAAGNVGSPVSARSSSARRSSSLAASTSASASASASRSTITSAAPSTSAAPTTARATRAVTTTSAAPATSRPAVASTTPPPTTSAPATTAPPTASANAVTSPAAAAPSGP